MSVVLDGVDQYLKKASVSDWGTPVTMSAWIKTDDVTSVFPVLGFDDGTADNYLLQGRGTTGGDPIGAAAHHLGGSWQIADTATGYSAGVWTHVIARFISSTSRASLINGGSKGTDTVSVPVTWVGATGQFVVGSYGGISTFAAGKIAEIAIWNTDLSDAQCISLAGGATPSNIQPDDIVAYWPLLDDAVDVVGSYDLTLYNTPTYSADHPTAGAGSSFADKTYSKKLIAMGNNELWHESSAGTMAELAAANGTINTNNPLTVAEAFQKVFVANQTNLKIADFANTKITTADLNAHAPDRGNILTGGTSGAKMVVDYITSVTADAACTIYGMRTTTATFASGETVTGTDDDSNTITFVLSAAETAAPHWYDWTPYGNDTTNFGSMPSSAYLVARYRGRLVLSGHPNYPHQWYTAKVSDPFNWKYRSTDPLSAVAGNNVDAGEIGDIVRALIPYGDDFLVFGCADSIHILDGDPVFGGSIDELSNITGMFGPWAWCKDEDGNLYFWGSGGLYKMAGGRSKPLNISQGHLPKWVDDWAVAPATHRVVLTYDPSRNGIIISKTTLADGTNLNYWYDLKTEGFYPETYPTNCGIFSSWYYDSDASGTRELILGTNDGYLRSFYDNKKDDYGAGTAGTTISSYVTLPIIKLNEADDSEGKLTSLTFELAGGAASGDFGDSDGVSYELHVADDAETVLEDIIDGATARESGTLSGTGRKNRIRKRVRGRWLGIKLYNSTAAETWAINSITGDIKPGGKIK